MFLYEQGYEIDGSDSSYCLVDHQTENLLEVVKYLLGLKIVNRKKEIKIRYTEGWSYNRKEWKEETFKWEEIENIDVLFQNPKLTICEIIYPLVNSNRLYPNIKKEIIDILLEREKKHSKCPKSYKKPRMENPVFLFRHFENPEDIFTVYPNQPNQNERHSVYGTIELDLQQEKNVQEIVCKSHCLLEISSALGANGGYHLYMMQKIAERFPEYEINVEDSMKYYEEEFISAYETLAERIYVKHRNVEELLHYLWKEKGILFLFQNIKPKKGMYHRKDLITSKNIITLIHIPVNLEKAIEVHKTFNKREPLYELLYAASGGKINLTFEEYGSYVNKLGKATLLSDYQFEKYTEIYFYYEQKIKKCSKTYLCRMGYERKKGTLQLYIDIPYALLECV